MSDRESDKGKSAWQEFVEGFREEADKPINPVTAKDLVDAAVGGTVETSVHPFRWLRTIFR